MFFINIAGIFDSPVNGLAVIKQRAQEVLFLHIDMTEKSSLQFQQQLLHLPACIFSTLYPCYTIKRFAMSVLDFIKKPFKVHRFAKAIERLKEFMKTRQQSELLNHTLGSNSILINLGND